MKTQAQKLSEVLKYGSLKMIGLDELKAEIKSSDNHLQPNKERLLELAEHDLMGRICYEWNAYNPDKHDFVNVRQFTKNPFTLIDMVYHTELGK